MPGFSLQEQYPIALPQVIRALCEAGFSAVSPVWTEDLALAALCHQVRACGMAVQSMHSPRAHVPSLWQPEQAISAASQRVILRALEACASYEIPILVQHGWQGLGYHFPETAPDFRFFDHLVRRAEQLGVQLAFENLEGEEYHRALLHRYKEESHVGFCWDSGHDRCYPHQHNYLEDFGDKLIMTHLNDNFGVRSPDGSYSTKDDLHYLPGDGNTEWGTVLARLRKCRRQHTLNFELKLRAKLPADDFYTAMTPAQYFAEAGRRALQLETRYTEQINL